MKELSLHILDLIQNSLSAGASLIEIDISESVRSDQLSITIKDNGKGMSEDVLAKATDPFYTSRTTRKVGFGLSLFKQAANKCGGDLEIISSPSTGTIVKAEMEYSHVDRQPLGDIAGVLSLMVSSNPEIRFIYVHRTDHGNYRLDSLELNNELGDVPVNHPEVIRFVKEMIRENIQEIIS